MQHLRTFLPEGCKAVEVGVFRGKYSQVMLRDLQPSTLYLVDPWLSFENKDYADKCNAEQSRQDGRYVKVSALFAADARVKIIRKLSLEAVKDFEPESLDFIYIDANHRYESCLEDLQAWYPILKRGGIMAGHDYIDHPTNAAYRVVSAVRDFYKGFVFSTNEPELPSFYWKKP